MNDEVIMTLLREIRDEQRALRSLVECNRNTTLCCDPDIAANLLRTIDVATTDQTRHVFNSAELIQHAQLEEMSNLKAAIVAAVGALNSRKLGRLLHRIEGIDVAGLRVCRRGDDRNGAIWGVEGFKPA